MFKRVTITTLLTVLFFLLAGVLTYFVYNRVYSPKKDVLAGSDELVQETSAAVSIFKEINKPILGKPVTLQIPTINLERDIVTVGTDSDGFMMTPEDPMRLGWFRQSSMTGDAGNIIINGHYDDTNGKPAAFWQLKGVQKGDKLSLVDEYGRYYTYAVTDVYYVAIDDPDRFKIFNSIEGKKIMTLITCGGVWLPQESTYNKRLIIRAEAIEK